MTPTPELRFVERETHQQLTKSLDGKSGGTWETRTVRVLQQKWVEVRSYDVHWTEPPDYEWRDVPIVKEDV